MKIWQAAVLLVWGFGLGYWAGQAQPRKVTVNYEPAYEGAPGPDFTQPADKELLEVLAFETCR